MNAQAAQIQTGFPSLSPNHHHHHHHHQQQQPSHSQPKQPHEAEERSRGRRRSRDTGDVGVKNEDGADGDVRNFDSASGAPSRKRRRSRKGLDKKFECPHEGCGKSYSRAEHLYRHQLNHNPKQIFSCDFPECRRSFVRQDLCTRHKERHTARGSQLQRKDAFMHNMNPFPTARPLDAVKDGEKFIPSPDSGALPVDSVSGADTKPDLGRSGSSGPIALGTFSPTSDKSSTTMVGSNGSNGSIAADVQPQVQSQRSDSATNAKLDRSNSFHGESKPQAFELPHSPRSVRPSFDGNRHSSFSSSSRNPNHHHIHSQNDTGGFGRPALQTSIAPSLHTLSLSSPYSTSPYSASTSTFIVHGQLGSGALAGPHHGSVQGSHSAFLQSQSMAPLSLPPPGYPTMSQTTSSGTSGAAFSTSPPPPSSSVDQGATGAPITSSAGFETMNAPYPYSIPVFGGEGYNRSPFTMADDFAAWLFSEQHQNATALSPTRQSLSGANSFMDNNSSISYHHGYFVGCDPALGGYYPQAIPQQHPMAVTSILDTSVSQSSLSEEKRQSLLELIEMRFNETDHAPVARQKEALFDGTRDDENHVLSLRMMQTYIVSYWIHVHPQLPILHKPTFDADKTQNLLLIAIMAIGASCLDKNHGHAITQAAAELSNFLSWHLRWEIFSDSDFRPPAKLWVFQALLLLEVYEKMYSTRALHERAHIHHATTITLMRRGSSLIGKAGVESPPSVRDDKQGNGVNGSNHATGSTTPDEWWNHWITNEATRRVAFAAFVIDSTHATMFGHSAVMVAHEMRLPLPCDEALWSATSSAEVGRVEAILHANGVKTTTFLDGLKKTLNGQNVRTNSFGRTILMAGLLSVSWHMNQRDLQVSSLGVLHALGGRDKWRGALTRAFDFWKADFDKSLAQLNSDSDSGQYNYFNSLQDTNIFESRNVLHHLAHMAMHVDIVDCQIFAGAGRLLGRAIGPQDYSSAQRRMKDWAPTARARDATFYAVRFLSQVLLPGNHSIPSGAASEYSARDDFLLNRPWVLYFAALIVWSYGYALDGPLPTPESPLITPIENMCSFLQRIGGVQSPEELGTLSGRNECVGLLLVLRDMFKRTRWELLHEAANLLTTCAEMLTGSN